MSIHDAEPVADDTKIRRVRLAALQRIPMQILRATLEIRSIQKRIAQLRATQRQLEREHGRQSAEDWGEADIIVAASRVDDPDEALAIIARMREKKRQHRKANEKQVTPKQGRRTK